MLDAHQWGTPVREYTDADELLKDISDRKARLARMCALPKPRYVKRVEVAKVVEPPPPPPEPPRGETALEDLILKYRTVVDRSFAPENSKSRSKAIILGAARDYNVTVADLKGESRTAKIAHARHVAMWRIAKETGLSLYQIGHMFGGRDHTTVLNGIRRINQLTGENVKTAGVFCSKGGKA